MYKFKVGDLVFAHFINNRIWPAKIWKTYNSTTFRIEFYNHDSIGIVDQADLELVNKDILDMYSQKFANNSHKNQKQLIQGIRLIGIDFERRENIRRKEALQWKNGVPNAEQKRRLELLLQAQYKRVVFQPGRQRQKQKEKKIKPVQQQQSISKTQKDTKLGQKGRSKRLNKLETEAAVQKSQISRITRSRKLLESQTNIINTRSTRSKNQEKSIEAEILTTKRKLRSSSKYMKEQSQELKKKYQPKQKKIKKKPKKDSKTKKQRIAKQPPKNQTDQQDSSKSSTPEDRDKAGPQNYQQQPNPVEPAEQIASENANSRSDMIEERHSQQFNQQEADEEIMFNEQLKQSQISPIINSTSQVENAQPPIDNPIQEQPFQQINQNLQQIPQPIYEPQHLQQEQPFENMNCDSNAQQNQQSIIHNAVQPQPQYRIQEYFTEQQQPVFREQVEREQQVGELRLPIMNNLDESESSHEVNSKPVSNLQQQTFYIQEINQEIENDQAINQDQQQQSSSLQYSISPQFTPNVSQNQQIHIQQHHSHNQAQMLPHQEQPRQQARQEQTQQQPHQKQPHQLHHEQQRQQQTCELQKQYQLHEQQQQQLPHEEQAQQQPHEELEELPRQQHLEEQPQYNPCEQQQQQLPHEQQQLQQPRENGQIEARQSILPQIVENLQSEPPVQEQTRQQNYNQQLRSASVKECQAEQINQQTFENLTPLLPNPLYSFIYSKRTSDLIDFVLDETSRISHPIQFPDQLSEHAQLTGQPTISISNHHSLNIANPSQNLELSQQGRWKQFQRLYCDFSINNNDFITMVQGIPSLKKKLISTDSKLMAMCFDEYLQILRKFISSENSNQPMKNLQMWQRQLLIAILNSNILDIKLLVQYEIMFRMMAFVSAFEKNRTHKRAQCHVEYLMVSIKMDEYISEFIKERNKGLYNNYSSSYDRLIRENQLRTMS